MTSASFGCTDHVAAISESYLDPSLDPLHVVGIEYFRPGTRCLAHTHAHPPAVSLFLLQSVLLVFLRSLPGRLSSFLRGKEIGWIPPILDYALYVCQRALLDDAVARPRLEWQVVERLQPILRLLGHCILAYNLRSRIRCVLAILRSWRWSCHAIRDLCLRPLFFRCSRELDFGDRFAECRRHGRFGYELGVSQ
jgi:hypothetical protein